MYKKKQICSIFKIKSGIFYEISGLPTFEDINKHTNKDLQLVHHWIRMHIKLLCFIYLRSQQFRLKIFIFCKAAWIYRFEIKEAEIKSNTKTTPLTDWKFQKMFPSLESGNKTSRRQTQKHSTINNSSASEGRDTGAQSRMCTPV